MKEYKAKAHLYNEIIQRSQIPEARGRQGEGVQGNVLAQSWISLHSVCFYVGMVHSQHGNVPDFLLATAFLATPTPSRLDGR